MAAPTLNTTINYSSVSSSSHSVSLGGTIPSGYLMVIILGQNYQYNAAPTITSSGWTDYYSAAPSGTFLGRYVYYKVSSGSDSTFTFTHPSASIMSATGFTVACDNWSASSIATASSGTTLDCPAPVSAGWKVSDQSSATWTNEDVRIIPVCLYGQVGAGTVSTGTPSGFSALVATNGTSTSTVGKRLWNKTSTALDDPAATTISLSGTPRFMFTFAVWNNAPVAKTNALFWCFP